MLGKLDVEKQEPTTDDTRSQAQQYGHKHFYGKILIVERNELRRSYQYQAHNYLTFQVGIGKDVFFGNNCYHQSGKNHQENRKRVRDREVHSYTDHDQHDIDKQRNSLRQEEAVGREKRHVLSGSLERKLYLRNQHQSTECQQGCHRKQQVHIQENIHQPCHDRACSNGEAGKPGGNIIRLRALERLACIYDQCAGKRHLCQPQKGTHHYSRSHKCPKAQLDIPKSI